MKLPDLRNFDLQGKRVLVRVDFDVPLIRKEGEKVREQEWTVGDVSRIRNALPTINYLLAQKAKVILLSHLGRPDGKVVPDLSLSPARESLQRLLPELDVKLITGKSMENGNLQMEDQDVCLLENLRFDPGEEVNSLKFAQTLTSLGDFYVNEAFAVSHREHASIVGLPKILPHAAGLNLLKEVEVLSGVLDKPKRPVVVILGGAKEDKLGAISGLLNFADHILVGGKLPSMTQQSTKIVIGTLNEEGKDITLETVEKFREIIEKAGTVIWAGPMGQYEDEDWEIGTREIGRAVADSSAFKVVGGGDTEAALKKFNLVEKIDFISSGGGAMLEFLARGDLPGLAALREL